MKQQYKDALDNLIGIIEDNRDKMLKNHEEFEESFGSLVFLGDKRYGVYSSMVDTNEYRAAKAIENIAVDLFSVDSKISYELYPVDNIYRLLPESEQKKTRPFQIVLTENSTRSGVVFSSESDIGKYSKAFINGEYKVDALKIVVIANPDDFSRDCLFTLVNKSNIESGIALERIPVLDFWIKYFGEAECNELRLFCNVFNEKAKEIIGYNTVVAPTDKALERFREECSKKIVEHNYDSNIPDTVYKQQVEQIKYNYIDRGLWRVMTGKRNFAVSYISSEWFYSMYQMTENLDLTNIVAGYLKSIEQLLFAIVQLSEGTGVTILSKYNGIVQLEKENEDIINPTLGVLEQVINHNRGILDINRYAKEYLVKMIDDWRDKQRNGYFHKDNLYDIEKVDEIREKAYQLYFLILGSCTIKDEQFSLLGIDE